MAKNKKTMIVRGLKQTLREFKIPEKGWTITEEFKDRIEELPCCDERKEYILEQGKTNEKLDEEFNELAKYFFGGGCIEVRDEYLIYPTTVEFYLHCEEGSPYDIKDPIVYHRNNRYVDGEVRYFPFMTFHAHASGIDIAFENSIEHYRASVLIRAYKVWDIKRGEFLKYDTKDQLFKVEKDEKKAINTQSTYLYNFLNGFGKGPLGWVDPRKDYESEEVAEPLRKTRQGVYVLDENNKAIEPKIKNPRKWQFVKA